MNKYQAMHLYLSGFKDCIESILDTFDNLQQIENTTENCNCKPEKKEIISEVEEIFKKAFIGNKKEEN